MTLNESIDLTDAETIDLTEDDVHVIEQVRALNLRANYDEQASAPLISFADDDDDDEDENDDCIRELTPSEKARLQRNTALDNRSGRTTITTASNHFGCVVDVNSNVELQGEEFMRVKRMFRERTGDVKLEGILLKRTRAVMNMLPKKCNEVCAIVTAREDVGSQLPDVDAYLVTRSLSDVLCTRSIIFTNQIFPTHSFREKGVGYPDWSAVEEGADLICRYKYVEFCDTVNWKVPSQAMVRLSRHECDIGVTDSQLMRDFRGMDTIKTPRKGERELMKTGSEREAPVDLTKEHIGTKQVTYRAEKTKRVNQFGKYERQSASVTTERFTPSQQCTNQAIGGQTYTFGDVCAGAGGATTAAKGAGLALVFAVDHAADPCVTLRLNFPGMRVLQMDIFDFCNENIRELVSYKIDVLHISFPCQVYSIAHTQPGKNDERNEAAGYSVIPLLKKCRPRIVTFEQSPNITKQHRPSFEALIHQIAEIGYSVRWKIVNFADTGNVQSRNRLVMFATCPGQPLPAFPEATHGDAPGLKRFTTINDILRRLPPDIPPHMADFVNWRIERPYAPYSGNQPLRGAITCHGGNANLHPNGLRPFSNQELALLQGFPWYHRFVGSKSSIMTQIGNAVPGEAFTPFFKEVVKCLEKFDKEVEREMNEVIEID